MNSPSAIALSGMNAAQTALDAAAQNIANLGTTGYRRQQALQTQRIDGGTAASLTRAAIPGNEPETDMVGLLQAKNSFLANLAVFKTGDRMTGSLLDALG
jgi:flagellar hook protein FlgE